MQVPFLDLKRAYERYGQELEEAVLRVLRSTKYLNGPETRELEKELATFMGVNHGIAVSSGTEALYLILKALDLPQKSVAFVPSFTFVSTAEVVLRAGLIPFFVDVEDDYPNLSLEALKEAYELCLKRGYHPVCVIAVSLYGYPARLPELLAFCQEKNLILIEDACQAFGSELEDKKVGSFGVAGAVSFYPTKNLSAAGDAGMVFTNDENLALKIRALKEHGQTKPYFYEYHGLNGRMDEVQAAILRVKFKYFTEELTLREKWAKLYEKNLSHLYPKVKMFKHLPNSKPALSLFTIRATRRNELQQYLEKMRIATNVYYRIPLHHQPIFKDKLPLSLSLPNTERLSQEVLSLPFFPYLKEEEVLKVCKAIEEFYANG
jgi:UDP-2-acetamido-2-deoxy-ribo-hexuluronate aminotransferase